MFRYFGTPTLFPNSIINPIVNLQPSNVDVIISKKSAGTELNDSNIMELKSKIKILNSIYNVIIKHLCLTKTTSSNLSDDDIVKVIVDELTNLGINLNKDLCFVTRDISGNCSKPMFTNDKLKEIVQTSRNDIFLSKACIYRRIQYVSEIKQVNAPGIIVPGPFGPFILNRTLNMPIYDYKTVSVPKSSNVIIQAGGNEEFKMYINQLLNTDDLKKEEPKFINLFKLLKNSDEHKCIHKNDHTMCVFITNDSNNNTECQFCDRWTSERNEFKNAIKNMISTTDPNELSTTMNQTIKLLPSVIMNKNDYNDFFKSIDEYNQFKQNKQLKYENSY